MTEKYNKDLCLTFLREKHDSLIAEGQSRYPQRGDFDIEQVVAIKAHLGPWPHALEAAGIKPPRSEDPLQRAREKHIRAKRKHNKIKKELKTQKKHNTSPETAFTQTDTDADASLQD